MGGVKKRFWEPPGIVTAAGTAMAVACAISLLLLLPLLSGCKTTKYVPVETVRYQDSVRLVERVDSIHVHDSVYVHQWHDHDTTWVEKVTVHTRYRDRWRADTILIHRRDSVPYPVEVTKEVVRYQLRWWQKPLVWLGGLSLAALAVLLLRWYARKRGGK